MNTLVQFMGVYEKDRMLFWEENSPEFLHLDWKAELKYVVQLYSLLNNKRVISSLESFWIEIPETSSMIKGINVVVNNVNNVGAIIQSAEKCFAGCANDEFDGNLQGKDLRFRLSFCDDNKRRFEIVFHFTQFLRLDRRLISKEALKPTICLEVQICSGNFSPSVNDDRRKYHGDTLLEAIKFALSEQMKQDWEKVVWILDKECEVLSEDLYLDLFHFETRLRQAVAYLMSRFFEPSDTISDENRKASSKFKGIDTRFSLEFGELKQYIEGLLGAQQSALQEKGNQMGEQVRYVCVLPDGKNKAYDSVSGWVGRYFCKKGQQPDKISIKEIEDIRKLRNKVAHYAPITNAYYYQQKIQLVKLNQKLSKIIDRMERDNVSAAQGEQRVLDAVLLRSMLKE